MERPAGVPRVLPARRFFISPPVQRQPPAGDYPDGQVSRSSDGLRRCNPGGARRRAWYRVGIYVGLPRVLNIPPPWEEILPSGSMTQKLTRLSRLKGG